MSNLVNTCFARKRTWTYLSGIAEISIGAGPLAPLRLKFGKHSVRLLAAFTSLLLFIVVYPANIKMAIDWSARPLPEPLFA